MNKRQVKSRGITLAEVLATVLVAGGLLVMLTPMLHAGRGGSKIEGSANNLRTLWNAHQAYAEDWGGRQLTLVADDYTGQLSTWIAYHGGMPHPTIDLGWSALSGFHGLWYLNHVGNPHFLWPIGVSARFGWFRVSNAKEMHDYVNGRFYDPTYYAPADVAPGMSDVGPPLEVFEEYIPSAQFNGFIQWSSYSLSPAALFSPEVLSREFGWQNPVQLEGAFTVPSFAHAKHPSLKTHMLEHHWLQNPPAPCNPAFKDIGTYDGCEPYYFNHGIDSSPVTLFYDGHIRQLPNTEVAKSDAQVLAETGKLGLFFRPGQMGPSAGSLDVDGYFLNASFDGTILNHHILTVDGIRGRDTLGAGK